MNICVLSGRLTRDPAMSTTDEGKDVAEFGLAVDRYYDRGETDFFEIKVFGKQAAACGQYTQKGRHVTIVGTLRQRRWTDEQTGKRRSRVDVVAQRVEFGPKPHNGNEPSMPTDTTPAPDAHEVEAF
jgi:single-strand DNA-binding protein